jgi:hypothetical protein
LVSVEFLGQVIALLQNLVRRPKQRDKHLRIGAAFEHGQRQGIQLVTLPLGLDQMLGIGKGGGVGHGGLVLGVRGGHGKHLLDNRENGTPRNLQ